MPSLNRVEIIGRIGKHPEIRYGNDGLLKIANFSVATSETWRDKKDGSKKENTEWHKVVAYNNLANLIESYLSKGSLVYISGKIKTRKFLDKQEIERYITEIIADSLIMLDSKESQKDHASNKSEDIKNTDDDIPF